MKKLREKLPAAFLKGQYTTTVSDEDLYILIGLLQERGAFKKYQELSGVYRELTAIIPQNADLIMFNLRLIKKQRKQEIYQQLLSYSRK